MHEFTEVWQHMIPVVEQSVEYLRGLAWLFLQPVEEAFGVNLPGNWAGLSLFSIMLGTGLAFYITWQLGTWLLNIIT